MFLMHYSFFFFKQKKLCQVTAQHISTVLLKSLYILLLLHISIKIDLTEPRKLRELHKANNATNSVQRRCFGVDL